MTPQRPPPRLLAPLLLLLLLLHRVECSAGVVNSLHVNARVEHRYASTVVTSRMSNPSTHHAAVRFSMQLPQSAFITAFVIEQGGRNLTSSVGEQLPPSSGRHSERRERSAWLVRQGDGLQLLEVSVGVEGEGKVAFHLTYEQLLRRVQGRYHYNLYIRPGQVVPWCEVVLHVLDREPITEYRFDSLPYPTKGTVKEGIRRPGEIVTSYLHAPGTAQGVQGVEGVLALSYRLRATTDGGEIQRENDHFVHTFSPDNLPPLVTHTLAALDVSLSSKGVPITLMKEALAAMVEEMGEEDTVEVLVFSSTAKSLGVFNGTRADRKKLRRVLKRLKPMGHSDLRPAFTAAVTRAAGYVAKNVARKVVLLSDGVATAGQTHPDAIRAAVAAANTEAIPIYPVMANNHADPSLLEHLAEDSRGRTLKLTLKDPREAKETARTFFREVARPVLEGVEAKYPRGSVMEDWLVTAQRTDVLNEGAEMVWGGVLTPDTKWFHPTVSAAGRSGEVELHVDRVDSRFMAGPMADSTYGVVKRTWAYLMVQDLLSKMAASDDPQVIVRLHYTLQDLATRYRFVTEFTALLVFLPDHGFELVYPQQVRPRSKKAYPASHTNPANHTFVVGDPHFVVHSPGVALPFCFSYHGYHGQALSLIHDPTTGLVVNGEVTAASHDPSQTYFSRLFFALGPVNVTVTQAAIHVDCLDDSGTPLVDEVEKRLYPFYDKRGRPYRTTRRHHDTRRHNDTGHQDDTTRRHNDTTRRHNDTTRNENETYRRAMREEDNMVHKGVRKGVRSGRRKGRRSAKTLTRKGGVNLARECNHRVQWEKGLARMYGRVVVVQGRGTSQLDVVVGDGDAHFAVTRAVDTQGQRHLGFFVEGQRMLSPRADGIIGQFNSKKVELLPSQARRCGDSSASTLVKVERKDPEGEVEISQMCGRRGSHHSTLRGEEVECITVGNMGLGLLDRRNYDLPCLTCVGGS